jgi:hypothetical protein
MALVALITGTASLSLVLVSLSPLALEAIGSSSRANWAKLSNIGQTYGAVSALLAALALAGVAVSIFAQVREARHNRWEAGRARHFELMRIAIEDPFYRQVFSMPGVPDDQSRLTGYINLLFEYWTMLWEFGDMPEDLVRSNVAGVLATEAGSFFWRESGSAKLEHSRSRHEYRFYEIANEVYRDCGIPPGGEIPAPAASADHGRTPKLARLLMCAAAGAVADRAITQYH